MYAIICNGVVSTLKHEYYEALRERDNRFNAGVSIVIVAEIVSSRYATGADRWIHCEGCGWAGEESQAAEINDIGSVCPQCNSYVLSIV